MHHHALRRTGLFVGALTLLTTALAAGGSVAGSAGGLQFVPLVAVAPDARPVPGASGPGRFRPPGVRGCTGNSGRAILALTIR